MITDDTYRLLRAIREFPDENAPRLILADEMQVGGFDLGAEYLRESVAHALVRRKKNLPRTKLGTGYIRWLQSLFNLPINPEIGICGGEGWDSFVWRTAGNERRCEMVIERGLPVRLRITAPMFMEQATKLFLFSLTGCKLVDRSPERDDFTSPQIWIWQSTSIWPEVWNTWEESVHLLPKPLFNLLPKQTNYGRGSYSTRSTAQSALQLAALAYGRAIVAPAVPA